MRGGKLDRRITIQQNTPTTDTFGEPDESWGTLATVWAAIDRSRGSQRFIDNRDVAENATVFKIRFRSDVTEKMRVSYDSKTWEIVGIEEIGRQEGLFLKTVALVP